MAFELVCQQCGVIGELEDPIDEFECPMCKGKMLPVKPHPPTQEADNTPTLAISRSQIQQYRNVKVAKTADFGFGGVVNAKLSEATRGIPVANTASTGNLVKTAQAIPIPAVPVQPKPIPAVVPVTNAVKVEAAPVQEVVPPPPPKPEPEILPEEKPARPPVVETAKPIEATEVQAEPVKAEEPVTEKPEVSQGEIRAEAGKIEDVQTPEPHAEVSAPVDVKADDSVKAPEPKADEKTVEPEAPSPDKTESDARPKEDTSSKENASAIAKPKTPPAKGSPKNPSKTPVKRPGDKKNSSAADATPKERKIKGTGKFEVIKGKGGVLQVFAPNGVQLSESDAKTYLSIRAQKHKKIVTIAIIATAITAVVVCGIIIAVNLSRKSVIDENARRVTQAIELMKTDWKSNVSPKVGVLNGGGMFASKAEYQTTVNALNAFIQKWDACKNDRDNQISRQVQNAKGFLKAAEQNKEKFGGLWQ